jgi:NodT family efflux transporter outer membrane factor (OMF) lipoprotein
MKFIKILIILTLFTCIVPPTSAKQQVSKTNNIEYINLSWWEKFNDNNLNSYMETAYKNNQDLKIATLNAKQGEQVVKMAFSNQLPQLGFSPEFSREFTSSTIHFGDVTIPDYKQSRFLMPLTMTYEADIWGENHLKTKSEKQKLEMLKQDERASYILISSNIASDYFNIIKADKLIQNQQKLIDLQEKICELYQQKYEGGLCSITDVLIQKQLLTLFKEELSKLKETQDILENQMKVALGDRAFGQIERSDYAQVSSFVDFDNVDTELIQNRPDIQKAEAYIQKIGIDVKVARREFLPKFLVFGQVGFNAYNLSKIFTPHSFLSNAGVLPDLDLFTGGRKMAMLKYQKLEYEKALQIYEKTILGAVQELNDSVVSYKTSVANYQTSVQRHEIEQEKYNLVLRKSDIGTISDLEKMEAQKALVMSEEQEISNKINTIISSINVYKSVGGVDYTSL